MHGILASNPDHTAARKRLDTHAFNRSPSQKLASRALLRLGSDISDQPYGDWDQVGVSSS